MGAGNKPAVREVVLKGFLEGHKLESELFNYGHDFAVVLIMNVSNQLFSSCEIEASLELFFPDIVPILLSGMLEV